MEDIIIDITYSTNHYILSYIIYYILIQQRNYHFQKISHTYRLLRFISNFNFSESI